MSEQFDYNQTPEISESEQQIIDQYSLNNTEWMHYRLTGELPERVSEKAPDYQASSIKETGLSTIVGVKQEIATPKNKPAVSYTEKEKKQFMNDWRTYVSLPKENIPFERKKTIDEEAALKEINIFMSEFVQHYGGHQVFIPNKNIHIIDESKIKKEHKKRYGLILEALPQNGALFVNVWEDIFVRLYKDEDTFWNRMIFIVHEMLRMNSFNSLTVKETYEVKVKNKKPHIFSNTEYSDRRSGVGIISRTNEKILGSINEAITEELTKRFIQKYFKRIPQLRSIALKLQEKINEISTKNPKKAEEYEDAVYHSYNDNGDINTLKRFTYPKERKNFKLLVNDIQQSSLEFNTDEEVFEFFAKAYMNGNIIPLARVINKLYKRKPIPGVESDKTFNRKDKRSPFRRLCEGTRIKR